MHLWGWRYMAAKFGGGYAVGMGCQGCPKLRLIRGGGRPETKRHIERGAVISISDWSSAGRINFNGKHSEGAMHPTAGKHFIGFEQMIATGGRGIGVHAERWMRWRRDQKPLAPLIVPYSQPLRGNLQYAR